MANIAIATQPLATKLVPRSEQFSIDVFSPLSRYVSLPTAGCSLPSLVDPYDHHGRIRGVIIVLLCLSDLVNFVKGKKFTHIGDNMVYML